MKDKRLFYFLLLLLLQFSVRAQDVILKKNGAELKVKILAVDSEYISYERDFDQYEKIFHYKVKKVIGIMYNSGVTTDAMGNTITATQFEYNKYSGISSSRRRQSVPLLSIGGVSLLTGAALFGGGIYLVKRKGEYPQRDAGNAVLLHLSAGLFTTGAATMIILGSLKLHTAVKYKRRAQEVKAELGFQPLFLPDIQFGQRWFNVNTGLAMTVNF